MGEQTMPERGPAVDHDCMDFRARGLAGEGDDVLTDGVRPMAWYLDPSNPTGHKYAYDKPHNDPDKPTVWRYPDFSSPSGDGPPPGATT